MAFSMGIWHIKAQEASKKYRPLVYIGLEDDKYRSFLVSNIQKEVKKGSFLCDSNTGP